MKVLKRPVQENSSQRKKVVSDIIESVKQGGDSAVKEFTQKFDGAVLDSMLVSEDESEKALGAIDPKVLKAIERAARQIKEFHSKQEAPSLECEVSPGIFCQRVSHGLEKVGLYVPGGTAPLPSTVLMLGVPAKLAGCREKILCTPPNKDGQINDAILVAAKIAGVDKVYKVGGAQAVAAMAYGTETIPKVQKIFGPGNAWVTEAKSQVSIDPNGAAMDMPAGPSEVLVIADTKANASFVAADLLSQAEHDVSSQVVLLTDNKEKAQEVAKEIELQVPQRSRQTIIVEALKNSLTIVTKDIDQCFEISREYAPEHLIVQVENPRSYLAQISNAGSVFLGPWTPEAVGDYASGTNHVLPTYGYAKSFSGLSLGSFQRSMTIQELTKEGLADIGPTVEILAEAEGLDAHKNAVTLRLETP